MTERRQNMRLKTRGLCTPFGEVMDISDSGMGVFRKGRVVCAVGDEVKLYLSHDATEIELNARVVRVSNVGLFRHEIGFEFIAISEETLTELWCMTDSACSEFTGPRCFIAA
ncbi:MAG: PilZ domain-containing protein [Phycisphaeraceae bacterium]